MTIAIGGIAAAAWIGFSLLGAWIFMLLWGAVVNIFVLDFFTPSFWQSIPLSFAVNFVGTLLFRK